MVVVAGAELFTGNCMIFIGYMEKRITTKRIFDHWNISLIGNFVGSLIVVCFMYKAHQFEFYNYMVGAKALLIANKKVNLTFTAAFSKAVLCNAMVCMAVWVCFSARNVADKIMTLVFPIAGFVASGFEHLVANMYFIPMGIILKSNTGSCCRRRKNGRKDIRPLQSYLERVLCYQSIPCISRKCFWGCCSGRLSVLVYIPATKTQLYIHDKRGF